MVSEKMAETPDRPPSIINITCGVEVGKLIVAKFGPRGTSRCIEHPLVKDHLLNPIEFTALGTRIAFYSGVWNIYEKIFSFCFPFPFFDIHYLFFLLPVPFFLALFQFLSFFPFSLFNFALKRPFEKLPKNKVLKSIPWGVVGTVKDLYTSLVLLFSLYKRQKHWKNIPA